MGGASNAKGLLALLLVIGFLCFGGNAHAAGLSAKDIAIKSNSSKTLKGKIEQGKKVKLRWASDSSVACFPATRNEHYTGKHLMYRVELPAKSVLDIKLTPAEPDLDLSLYAYSVGKGDTKTLPPNIPGVVSCEASGGSGHPKHPFNPGAEESVQLNATTNPYTVYIGVAGAKGISKGSFSLSLSLRTAKPEPTGKIQSATQVKLKAGTTKLSGKLDGGPQIALQWAANSSVACFPATRKEHYNGAHVLYRMDLPARSVLKVKASPKSKKTDISLYAYQVGQGDTTTLPPNIPGVVSCEASAGSQSRRSPFNPGESEEVRLNSTTNAYTVYVAVAGAKGTMKGGFDLQFDLNTAKPEPTGKISSAKDVKLKPNAVTRVKGSLRPHPEIPLSWAANSSVACFPATRNEHFNGSHQLYRVDLPPKAVLNVKVTPKSKKTDISLYAYQVGKGDKTTLPPNINSVVTCEASAGSKSRKQPFNPGEAESVRLNSIKNPYTVYVGVAGAQGLSQADFELEFDLKVAKPEPTGKISSAEDLKLKPNAVTKVKGSLRPHPEIPLSWASNSSVACFPATRNEHFNGAHKLYRVELPPQSELKVKLTPKSKKADLSLYAYQVGKGDTKTLPPNISSVVTCEASYGSKNIKQPFNPGGEENVRLNSIKNPYTVYVGVAGAQGLDKGDFELEFDFKTAGPKLTGQVSKAQRIDVQRGTSATVSGKIDDGPQIDLAWAANSSVACFPATRNEHYNGNHVMYAVDLPSYSELTVKLVPADPKLDLSLYAYTIGAKSDHALPPNVHSVVSCEASAGSKSLSQPFNPGDPEQVKLLALRNPYTALIGVTGAKKITRGSFKLEVTLTKR